jgi:two-component system LytT family response regulator
MKAIDAVIIDDEADSISLLELQLQKNCPQVNLIKSFNSSVVAMDELPLLSPGIVFLDIEMPNINGFELLEKLSPLRFKVIFVTAHNQYAIKAFRFNALDYLVKPIAVEELVQAVEKSVSSTFPSREQMDMFNKQMKGEPISKIAVSAQSGVQFINLNDIVYVEASSNYSKLIMNEGSSFVISRTLKDIQDVLEGRNFFRIHRQYIINLNKVKHFNRIDSTLIMDNKAELPVARVQKEKLVEKFDWL